MAQISIVTNGIAGTGISTIDNHEIGCDTVNITRSVHDVSDPGISLMPDNYI